VIHRTRKDIRKARTKVGALFMQSVDKDDDGLDGFCGVGSGFGSCELEMLSPINSLFS
jgi:hypothetical protein